MGTIHKTVTRAVLAANQANSAASTGPATESGQEQSKMNAFKSGKYARRPDPVELLLKDHTAEEEAEREELREEMVRCYQPPDDFARLQVEELADLQFERRRLERAQEVVLRRERELLTLEQRQRAFGLKHGCPAAGYDQVVDGGLVRLSNSPGKFKEMLRILQWLLDGDGGTQDARLQLHYLFGRGAGVWRGQRLWAALQRAEGAETEESLQQASQRFRKEVEHEIERVGEELAICEREQGPLSQAGEAARLLEAMGSRRWSWMRQREMFLRRSIDRKVQVLIELRREANRAEYRATGAASKKRTAGGPGPGGEGSDDGAAGGGASPAGYGSQGGATVAPAPGLSGTTAENQAPAVTPDSRRPGPEPEETVEASEGGEQGEASRIAQEPEDGRNDGRDSISNPEFRTPSPGERSVGNDEPGNDEAGNGWFYLT